MGTESGCPNQRMFTHSTKTGITSVHQMEVGNVSRSIPLTGTNKSTAKSGGKIGQQHKTQRSKQPDEWNVLICVPLNGRGIENRLPQKHLGPTASALERKGISSKHGDENRKIISLNALLASLQKTVHAIGAWLDNLRNAISRQQIIENPDEYPLSNVLIAYLDMRKNEREWVGPLRAGKRRCP